MLYVACVVLVCCVFVLFACVMGIVPLVGLDSVLLLVSVYVVCLIGGTFGLSRVVRLCCLANWLRFGMWVIGWLFIIDCYWWVWLVCRFGLLLADLGWGVGMDTLRWLFVVCWFGIVVVGCDLL